MYKPLFFIANCCGLLLVYGDICYSVLVVFSSFAKLYPVNFLSRDLNIFNFDLRVVFSGEILTLLVIIKAYIFFVINIVVVTAFVITVV